MNLDYIRDIGWPLWIWRTARRRFSQRILRKGNRVSLPTGLQIYLPKDSLFGTEVYQTRCCVDWGSERVFSSVLDPLGVVLDVGANIGYYSLYVLPLVSAVYAFEPDDRTQATLDRNLAPYPNAKVQRVAVGSVTGRAHFVSAGNSELSHLSLTPAVGFEIDVTTLDRFVEFNQVQVTGIKIDAEGWDLEVIKGALGTLEGQQPIVLTEANPDAKLFGLVRPLEYRVFAFIRGSRNHNSLLRGVRYEFAEIREGSGCRTKMLFLVPRRLHKNFESLVSARASEPQVAETGLRGRKQFRSESL